MAKLYLVDGHALVFRAYYALINRPLINSRGQNTGAVHNFFRMLVRAIRNQKPDYFVVVFDARGKNFRHELYPEYKATRVKAPEDLLAQLPWITELVELFGIPHVSREGFEADDLIASFVRHARAAGDEVRILSADKDLMQLVGDDVHMLVPARDPTALFDEFGPAEVAEKFGVPPTGIADYLSIVGDSSDNVPGVRGLGEKGAVKLLAEWGSLDAIYANIDSVTPDGVRRKLVDGRDSAMLSHRLVRLDADLPRPLPLETCRFTGLDTARALPRLAELELRQLIGELERDLPARPAAAVVTPGAAASAKKKAAAGRDLPEELELFAATAPAPETPVALAEPAMTESAAEVEASPVATEGDAALPTSAACGCRYVLVDTLAALEAMLAELALAPLVAVDSETTSLDAHAARLLGLSFSCRTGHGWYVPLGHNDNPLDGPAALERIRPLLADANVAKTGQNVKYECQIFRALGIEFAGIVFDTMLAAYLLEPGSRVNLDGLAARHLGRRTIRYEEVVQAKGATLLDAPLERVAEYAAEDAEVTFALTEALRPLLAEAGLDKVLAELELPLAPVLAAMEYEGIRIDVDQLAAASGRLAARLAELETEIATAAGSVFNLNSPKQLAAVLFETLGLPPVKKTKTGYSTDEEVLQELAPRHPVPRLVLEYRKASKLKSTYLDALPLLVNARTGRLHTSYNQAVTTTGRLSSSEPNLQNIPIRDDAGREVRKAFVPREGWVFVGADYSQIELRILAALSGDEALASAYASGEDIHRRTAALVFGISESAVDRDRRGIAKAINFGVIYGQTAYGLSRELGIPRSEADNFIRAWFEAYSGVRAFADRVIEEATERGFVRTWFGRLRRLPELASRNRNLQQQGERLAVNTLIQGTAADLVKLAMIGVSRRLADEKREARLLLQVHDELLVECPPHELEAVKALVVEEMSRPWPFAVPLEIGAGSGQNWDEAH